MHALKSIVRYIKDLHLYPSSTSTLISYTDADWVGCLDTRRSISSYYVFLGDNFLTWSSKKQATSSRFNSEAEYRGVVNVVFESCWLHNILLELHCPIQKVTLVHCDNVNTLYLLGNHFQH